MSEYNNPYIIERYYAVVPDSNNSSDQIATIALLVSVITVLLTYYLSFLNKRLDVKLNYFNQVIIIEVDSIFNKFLKTIEDNPKYKIATLYTDINTFSDEIDSFVVSLKSMYYKFQQKKLIENKESFCDLLFDNTEDEIQNYIVELRRFESEFKIELYKKIENQFSIRFRLIQLTSIDRWKSFYYSFKDLFQQVHSSK